MIKERYKWNGKCPDCGAKLDINREQSNYSALNRIEFDCPKCGYWSEGWIRSNRKLTWLQKLYYKNWKPHLWKETISPLQKVSEDMKYWKERIDWLTEKAKRGEIDEDFIWSVDNLGG